MEYNHREIELKWQKKWDEARVFYTDLDDFTKPKAYVLDMFPYPSGAGLHVGHPKGYCATDAIARWKRMLGYNVLHPIGWDAFGLPAEQYALKTGNHPATFTLENINNFRKQLKSLGLSYDYSKEVNTIDPHYYKITQLIFKYFFDHNLAQLREMEVNYSPTLKTVLANEEVLTINGEMVAERDHNPVIKKMMRQWILLITKYADKLLTAIDKLDWPHSLKELQRNWIGKSIGVVINFSIPDHSELFLPVFTTRPDTVFGITYLAIAPEHPLLLQLLNEKNKNEIKTYLAQAKNKSALTRKSNETLKTGLFSGLFAINPFNNEQIPIWIADYVLKDYGTGIVMGVPAHDERDFLFAQNHQLPVKFVLQTTETHKPYLGDGLHCNSDFLNGLDNATATKKIKSWIKTQQIGAETTTYKLRDWLFARQRYWGEPFPIIHWKDNTITVVPESELPVLLPEMSKIAPADGKSPLENAPESWLYVTKDGKKGKRETDTMPQWAGSSWYYLAYLLKKDDGTYYDLNSAIAKNRFAHWLPVDLYVGGQEHAVLHLLYARFWHKFLYDCNIIPKHDEPFWKVVNQGMILGENNEKMSKSKGNVVNPDDIIAHYGADTLRLYEMFMGPLTASTAWSEKGLEGIARFLNRVYRLFTKRDFLQQDNNGHLDFFYHNLVLHVTADFEKLSFNTAIAELMTFINECYKQEQIYEVYAFGFLKLLNPLAPHLSEELWSQLYPKTTFLALEPWPVADKTLALAQKILLPIQVNGKKKGAIEITLGLPQETVIAQAKQEIIRYLTTEPTAIKYVPNRIINFIVKA